MADDALCARRCRVSGVGEDEYLTSNLKSQIFFLTPRRAQGASSAMPEVIDGKAASRYSL